MTGRELVFSNPLVIRMITEHFVPVAENVTGLQQADDEQSRFFRYVAVQGHMKGRSRPENSHQGIYAFAADGTAMATGNPLQADKTLALLEEALQRWAEYEERPEIARGRSLQGAATRDTGYPSPGGLVLRMAARDLPRPAGVAPPPGQERYVSQWNFDHIWLRPDQVRQLLPETMEDGAERQVPEDMIARIARFHLRDIVRGEPRVWGPESVERAGLTTRVTGREGSQVTLALTGNLVLREHVAFRDAHKPIDWEFDNELDAVIGGEAVWDADAERFARLDMVVAGQRSGAHRYNARTQDPGPTPIGFAFELAGDEPWERTPPHAMRTWSRPGEPEPPVATTVSGESYYGHE